MDCGSRMASIAPSLYKYSIPYASVLYPALGAFREPRSTESPRLLVGAVGIEIASQISKPHRTEALPAAPKGNCCQMLPRQNVPVVPPVVRTIYRRWNGNGERTVAL